MNLVLAVMTLIVGVLQSTFGWIAVCLLFIGVGIFSLACAVTVNLMNGCWNGKLNWSRSKLNYYNTLGQWQQDEVMCKPMSEVNSSNYNDHVSQDRDLQLPPSGFVRNAK